MSEVKNIATKKVHMGKIDAIANHRADGTILISTVQELPPFPTSLMNKLEYWAQETPDHTFLADRNVDNNPANLDGQMGDGWQHLSFARGWNTANSIGQALLERGLNADRPLVILSGNSVAHGQLALGCQVAGIPYAPVSPAYSLRDPSYKKLKHIFALLMPGLVFVDDFATFEPALLACVPDGVEIVALRGASKQQATPFAELAQTLPGPLVESAYKALTGNTIAKFLFTSGSTGLPKAVINTHAMIASNQVMIANALAFLADQPPVLVDWLPWNHTAGGNHNFGIAVFNGGTLYVDDGKPVQGAFDKTVANLTQIAPSVYFGVPKSYEMLVDALSDSETLCQKFFSKLHAMQYAGAGLSQHVWNRLEELAVATIGEKVLIMTGYGSTETAPFAFTTTGPVPGAGFVGVPSPGLDVKLVPVDDKLSVRVRGYSITPGYWRMPEATKSAFDDEGYFDMGDALKFVDPDNANAGFSFDGRVSEDFKLSTGTWVNMGKIRSALVSKMGPFVRDAVITGLDRNFIAAMAFLDIDAVRRAIPELSDADQMELADNQTLRQKLQSALNELAATSSGSSTRVARFTILKSPPSLELGEVTDKGSINQRAVMAARADLVEELYAKDVGPHILEPQ